MLEEDDVPFANSIDTDYSDILEKYIQFSRLPTRSSLREWRSAIVSPHKLVGNFATFQEQTSNLHNFYLAQLAKSQRERDYAQTLRAQLTALAATADASIIHACDPCTGRTILHDCILHGTLADVRLLVTSKASLEKRDDYGETPLSLAVWAGKTKAVSILLEADASIHAGDTIPSLLHRACRNNQYTMVQQLLRAGCDPNMQHGEACPCILTALAYSSKECVVLLLDSQADISQVSTEGQTVLHWAVQVDSDALSELLSALQQRLGISPCE